MWTDANSENFSIFYFKMLQLNTFFFYILLHITTLP